MSSQRAHLAAKHFRVVPAPLLITMILITVAIQSSSLANPPQDTLRTIVSDDFIKNRPRGRGRRSSARKSGKVSDGESSTGRNYRLASQPSMKLAAQTSFAAASQLGLTVWKLRRANVADFRPRRSLREKSAERSDWIEERVEADTAFHEGDYLRLSIESPREGYLYVIDRDWFTDDDLGETSLIFPIRGDDNRLHAGKLIDIPAENQAPFKATPKPNQAGEILTIVVTASPLGLPISDKPLPISKMQLSEWEEMWGGTTTRFELQSGAGQVRTRQEQQAAASKGTRQLTRDDPAPQTIYLLAPKNSGAFLFNVKLSYIR